MALQNRQPVRVPGEDDASTDPRLPDDFAPADLSAAWNVVAGTEHAAPVEEELRRELPVGHVLDTVEAIAVGVHVRRRPAIFFVPALRRWAVVHLTHSIENDPRWPSADMHATWRSLLADLEDRGRS